MSDPTVIELNILGQVCPACLLVVLKELNTHRQALKQGKTRMIIKTDHRDTTRTIPVSAVKMGYKVDVTKKDTYYEIEISQK